MAEQIERYNPQEVESKWRQRWEEAQIYVAPDDSPKPKWYSLVMYPYPSGDLHIGHWYNFALADFHARYKRMRGFNVMQPIGFDAFGLPAENAAIKHGIHPYKWTMANIERMRGQLRSIGASYDWSREVVTCVPEYYRWNQWFFIKLYERGLAYRARAASWWCPTCNTVLANEQVVDGACERCGSVVSKRDLEQWFLRLTAYADELLRFDGLEWPEKTIAMQRNWIGRSEGVRMSFAVEGVDERIEFFTTRPDTVFGVSFMVLAPEHPLVDRVTTPEQRAAVTAYQEQTRRETEIERLSTEKEKTGVFTGGYAIHAFTGERVPIWIADYVLMGYGTGAIMAVPAHDQRDFEFAQKYGLPIRVVIAPPDWTGGDLPEAYTGPGVMVNSGEFDGTPSDEGKTKIAEWVEARGLGQRSVNYRVRDWLISRQRYWGTPIPMVYCDGCGIVPVPEDQLPVLLPEDAEFRPTGESPLKYTESFVNTTCPKCGGPAKRETDTMDTFVDSSWYFFRYCSPKYEQGAWDRDLGARWMPVDQYMGGAEHAVMHLLYARFFTKALADLGLTDVREPFTRLFHQGIILGEDNEKMSKSRGNVVNPDDYVQTLGADAVRAYLAFLGPWDQGGPWSSRGIQGIPRWLNRVWSLVLETWNATPTGEPAENDLRTLRRWQHRTIKRVTEDVERFRFNTMLAALMEYTNALGDLRSASVVGTQAWREAIDTLLLLLAPIAPHITEELWERCGHEFSVHTQAWPEYEERFLVEETKEIVVQVNGKVRDRLTIPVTATAEEVKALTLASERVRSFIDGKEIKNVVYVPQRLVNVVVG